MRKLLYIESLKTIGFGPVKILIPLHLLFFVLGFFAIPNIQIDFPFLSVIPLYQFPHVWNFITWVGGFYHLTLVILVIMLTCLEFSNKTYKHQVIFGLKRDELFYQKVILVFVLSVYVVVLSFGTILASGLIYSYKITFQIMFERVQLLLSAFLQTFTWLMTGVLFALIFKNMILSVLGFGFYRIILEPVLRNLVSDKASWFFPTKFISRLTPEPDILSMIEDKLKTTDQATAEELSAYNDIIPDDVPYWQNVLFTIIYLCLIMLVIRYLFRKRRLN